MTSEPSRLGRQRIRRAERFIRELNAPATLDVPLPLPIALEWKPGEDLRRFAVNLAAANGYSLSQIMGMAIESSGDWRVVDLQLRQRLSALTGQPVEDFAHEPRQYQPVVKRHPLTGWIEPAGTDPGLWVEQLPDTVDGRRIRDDVRTTTRRQVRLDLLTDLAMAVVPHLSASWPAHASFDLEERATVTGDPTRHQPIASWSPIVRRYALLALWDHTDVGRLELSYMRCRTPVARDLLTVQTWRDAATAATAAGLPRVSEALLAAIEQWPPAQRPTTPTGTGELPAAIRIRAATGPLPGPFSLLALRTWPPVLVYAVHAADIALEAWRHHQNLAAAWTLGALSEAADRLVASVEADPRVRAAAFRYPEPAGFATAGCRLLATNAGRRVLVEVADLAGRDIADAATVRAWWPTLQHPPDQHRARWTSLRDLEPDVIADLLWVDLTGHLPTTLAYQPSEKAPLLQAARAVAPEDVLAMRDWARALIDGTDLPATPDRAARTPAARAR